MEIAFLLEQALAPVPGGTGRHSVELARALARTAGGSDRVTGVTAWHRDVSPATVPGVRGPHRLPLGRRAAVAVWERGLGPRLSGDVVHAPTPLFPPVRRRGGRQRLVVTVHDLVPWTYPETLTPRGVLFHQRMVGRAVDEADVIAVPTRVVGEQLRREFPALGAERVAVIGGGVADALWAEPAPDAARAVARRLELPERYVLSLATVEPRKGLDVLIAAMGRLPEPVPLLLVGQAGWGDVDLTRLATAAGLGPERVRPLGRLSDAELSIVLRRATLLCSPSLAEGFGLPIAEAMAAGTAVICSDDPAQVEVAGPAAEVFRRGDAVDLNERLEGLLGDPERRAELVRVGAERVGEFTWEQVAQRCWDIYRSLRSSPA